MNNDKSKYEDIIKGIMVASKENKGYTIELSAEDVKELADRIAVKIIQLTLFK